jgi:hypothetical protein
MLKMCSVYNCTQWAIHLTTHGHASKYVSYATNSHCNVTTHVACPRINCCLHFQGRYQCDYTGQTKKGRSGKLWVNSGIPAHRMIKAVARLMLQTLLQQRHWFGVTELQIYWVCNCRKRKWWHQDQLGVLCCYKADFDRLKHQVHLDNT